jgi:hypothetical protein
MAINLSNNQLDPAVAQQIISLMQQAVDLLNNNGGRNLTPEERQQYGSINERNKLITSKAQDFHKEQPALQSPDVDWAKFDASWATRTAYAAIENLCKSIIEISSDTRILHDYDLYQMTLTDYDYTKYKAGSTNASGGYTTKYEEMKQFFPGTGGNGGEKPAES